MKKRPRLFVGVGVLCFVGVMTLWLASSGDKAIADKDNAPIISQSLTQSMNTAMDINGVTKSKVTFKGSEGVVQKVSVYVNVQSADARSLKVWLTSPSGTKVQLVDGAKSDAVKKDGLEGWFSAEGLSTIQSLDAFAGEPATGDWQLSLDSERGKLVKWSVTTDLSPNAKMAGMETYGEYDGSDGGCDCRVAGDSTAQGLLSVLFLLGLVLIRRRS